MPILIAGVVNDLEYELLTTGNYSWCSKRESEIDIFSDRNWPISTKFQVPG